LFASEEDPLFSGLKPKTVAVSINSAMFGNILLFLQSSV
jgi:hypothetical protein